MKIMCDSKSLSEALKRNAQAVKSKAMVPAMEFARLEASEDGTLAITTTCGELTITTTQPCLCRESGVSSVLFRKLLLLASQSKCDIDIESTDDGKCRVKAGENRFSLSSLPDDSLHEYATMLADEPETVAVIGAPVLSEMAKSALSFASTDESRAVLAGIMLRAAKSQLKAVATDGRRVIELTNPANDVADGDGFDVLLSRNAAAAVASAFAGIKKDIAIVTGKEQHHRVSFRSDDVELTCATTEGTYPNYGQVFPDKFSDDLKIGKEDLLSAIRLASICNDAEDAKALKLILDSDSELTLNFGTKEGDGEYSLVKCPCDAPAFAGRAENGTGLVIALNPSFVVDMLNSCSTEKLTMILTDDAEPTVAPVTFVNDVDMRAVIMPMRS